MPEGNDRTQYAYAKYNQGGHSADTVNEAPIKNDSFEPR